MLAAYLVGVAIALTDPRPQKTNWFIILVKKAMSSQLKIIIIIILIVPFSAISMMMFVAAQSAIFRH